MNINDVYKNEVKIYWSRRILKYLDLNCSHKKVLLIMKFLKLKPNNYKIQKNKLGNPEKIGKYPRLFKYQTNLKNYGDNFSVDITEKIIAGCKLYTCAFYHVNTKKVYGLVTKNIKGMKLVLESFFNMVNEFGTFKPNSIIHSDNGSEFKSYQYRLATMWFVFGLSMSRIGRSTYNGYIEGFEVLLKEKQLRSIINTML
ncbi:DDE-type integrase/transposase/recombinase [Spiroplasma endosymbiont of Cantharis nigra]|uniref:DDE-type integrase/transposase/recombinase n=1 Tax=Spiroplasma endosymbiont of Cantharis nigra TaxID=3066278 RepID=UPI0030D59662